MSFEKEVGNAGTWIKKHARLLIVLLFAYLLLASPIGMMIFGSIVNPGFPGAEVSTYGVNFKDFGSDWTGTNKVWVSGASGNPTDLVTHSSVGAGDQVYFGDCSSTSLTVVHDYSSGSLSTRIQLETDVQSPIPLASYNYQNATPLNIGNSMSWDQGEELSYWNPTGIQSNVTTTLQNGTQIQSVTYTGVEENLLLIPGNFWLDITIPSGRSQAGTDSGWEEGSWSSVDLWYEIYWYNWLNAYSTVLENYAGTPPSQVTQYNARAEQFNNVGGFPIQGWIQQYQSLMNGFDLSSIIVGHGDGTTNNLTASGVPLSTLANIEAQISLAPQYNGQSIPLYTGAGDSYQLPTWGLPVNTSNIDLQAQGLLHSPDFQTVLPAEFFKIHINNIGTWTDGSLWSGWTVYYPAVSYLCRFIFGVYGEQPFVWTVNTALNLGYNATANYQVPPAQWTNKQIVTGTQAGIGTGLLSWFSNPLNALQFYVILAVIVVLLVTVFNPGVWSSVLGHRREE